MLSMALIFAFIRMLIGPTLNDRIASMDLIAVIVMGFILLYSLQVKNQLYIDIAIVISLTAFIGTLAISTYLKKRNDDHNN